MEKDHIHVVLGQRQDFVDYVKEIHYMDQEERAAQLRNRRDPGKGY